MSTASYTVLTVTLCRSECCVPSGLDFEAADCTLYCVQLFASRASYRCKHDAGALSWLNVETVNSRKSAHPPLWQTCKVLRAHERSFGRLRYSYDQPFSKTRSPEIFRMSIQYFCSSLHAWSRNAEKLLHRHIIHFTV